MFQPLASAPALPPVERANIERAVRRCVEDSGFKIDAGETMLISRALEQIVVGNFNYKYAANKALQLFAVDRNHGVGKESYTYRQYDFRGGKMRPISDWSKDFPQGTAKKYEATAGYRSYGAGYSYSLQELRRSVEAQEPLETTLATVTRSMAANTIEDIVAVGDVDTQMSGGVNPIWGMLNAPNVPVLIPRLSASGATGVASVATSASPTNVLDFTTATAEQIAAALDSAAAYVSTQSKDVFSANRAVLPLDCVNFLKTKQARSTYQNTRLYDDVIAASKFIKTIEAWLPCSGAGKGSGGAGNGSNGVTGNARAIIDGGANTDVARIVLPVEFEQFAPQVQGLSWFIPCHMRTGGAFVPQPMGMCYLDGFGF